MEIRNKKNNKVKVLMAMSGGVDSSVAAALLVKQGYDVVGAFMVNYQEKDQRSKIKDHTTNCWISDYRDAVRVAAKLNIPLLKLDFTKEYRDLVLAYMKKEYEAGRTPNPDVMCNKFVKFGVWMDWAKEKGFQCLATGHYARLGREIQNPKSKIQNNSKIQNPKIIKLQLEMAKDKNKDQTYFLHQLSQEQLKHVMFPIGDYTKVEVRKLAKKFDLSTADKEESMGICFIGEVPMKEFLKNKMEIKTKIGEIVMSGTGEMMGEHQGLAFYTIGERIGLERSKIKDHETKPLFIIDKNIGLNQLIVGYEDDPLLYKKEIEVSEVNWISGFIRRSPPKVDEGGQTPKFPLKCLVRLRHRQPLQKAIVIKQETKIKIIFDKSQRAVTPGQFAVIYKNNECLGGGVIV